MIPMDMNLIALKREQGKASEKNGQWAFTIPCQRHIYIYKYFEHVNIHSQKHSQGKEGER